MAEPAPKLCPVCNYEGCSIRNHTAEERIHAGVRFDRKKATIPATALTNGERWEAAQAIDFEVERPRVRGDCEGHQGPCPFVSCRYHLYLDVNEDNGSIKLNFPTLEVWEMEETCALDIAARGRLPHREIGEAMNIGRERARQIEVTALVKLRGRGAKRVAPDDVDVKRRPR